VLNLQIALGVVITVVSAAGCAFELDDGAAATRPCEVAGAGACPSGDCVLDGSVDDAEVFVPEMESFPTVPWPEGFGLDDGNNS
jgi:hypothetical protein